MRAEEQASAYFQSSQALKSDDPAVRRPAISTLIALAQQAVAPVSARASAVLTKEFGPFVVTEGLSGCAAPISAVHQCDAEGRDCRACEWLWDPPSASGSDSALERDARWPSEHGRGDLPGALGVALERHGIDRRLFGEPTHEAQYLRAGRADVAGEFDAGDAALGHDEIEHAGGVDTGRHRRQHIAVGTVAAQDGLADASIFGSGTSGPVRPWVSVANSSGG